MNARVGTPSANDVNFPAGDPRQSRLQRILHRAAARLRLPAAKGRTVVFDAQRNSHAVFSLGVPSCVSARTPTAENDVAFSGNRITRPRANRKRRIFLVFSIDTLAPSMSTLPLLQLRRCFPPRRAQRIHPHALSHIHPALPDASAWHSRRLHKKKSRNPNGLRPYFTSRQKFSCRVCSRGSWPSRTDRDSPP